MAETDHIAWLMNWYRSQCNGDWEHRHGVVIETLDNPGWSLIVDLERTPLDGRPFNPVFENVAESQAPFEPAGDGRWMVAKVEGNKFKAYGGSGDLFRLVGTFRSWVMEG
jgi:hypothetical protein